MTLEEYVDALENLEPVMIQLIDEQLHRTVLMVNWFEDLDDENIFYVKITDMFQAQNSKVIGMCRRSLKQFITETFGWKIFEDELEKGDYNVVTSTITFELTKEQLDALVGYCRISGGFQ